MNSFTTFIPVAQQSKKINGTQLVSFIWFIALVGWIGAYFTDDKLLKVVCWSVFLFGVLVRVFAFFFIKKPKRTIGGEIIFDNDIITVNGVGYDISSVEKIEFTDLGNFLRKNEGFIGDKQSWPNGKDIRVILDIATGEDITIQFQLNHRHQMQDIRPQLVHYHNEGKLHFLNLINILGIEDYNAIQIFKKSLPEGGNVKSY